jgi:glucose/arabinose dehydrogenase
MKRSQRRPHVALAAHSSDPILILAVMAAFLLGGIAVAQDGGDFQDLELELVAEGFTSPVALVTPPEDDRRFVVDQVGQIHVLNEDGSRMEEPFLDVSDRMVPLREGFDERGLLGLAFHPEYADNGRFYVYYSAPLSEGSLAALNHTARVSEFQVSDDDPNRTDPDSERVVLQVDQPQFNHNGGQLAFGPDGYLYFGLGDGGGANDNSAFHPPLGNGQDVTTLLGAILRIDVDDMGDGERAYGIPDDNPFTGDVELDEDLEWSGTAAGLGAREEIYHWGLRNPYRFSFDRETGDMWIADVGQNTIEEHSRVTEPSNLGWNIMEGDLWFDPENPNDLSEDGPTTGPLGEELVMPVITYGNLNNREDGRGISTTGGYVYRGDEISDLAGHYVFGDWSTGFTEPNGQLFIAEGEGDDWSFVHERSLDHFLLAFGEDADGELYLLTTDNTGPQGDTGRVYRLVGGNGN